MRRKPSFFGRTAFTARGASIVEILVSLVIVLIAALAAGSFFSQQMSLTRNLTRQSACRAALDSQLSYFREMGAAAGSYAWDGKSGAVSGLNVKTVTTGLDDPWLAKSVREATLETTDVLESGVSAPVLNLNTHLLMRGSMGAVAALYNNVPGICSGVDLTSIAHNGAQAFPAAIDDDLLNGFKSEIQITPYDLGSGTAVAGCSQTWARPQGVMEAQLTSNKIAAFNANTSSKVGYRVKLKGSYTDSAGAVKSCESSEDFSYPVDRQPQKLSVVLNAFDPSVDANSIQPAAAAMEPIRLRPRCSHTSGQPASLRLEVGFNSSVGPIDPGTIFLCKDRSEQINPNFCPGASGAAMDGVHYSGVNANWVPCGEVTACGIVAHSVTYANSGSGKIKYVLNYDQTTAAKPDGLWGCDIRMDVATVDAAGNFQLLSSKAHPGPWTLADATGGKYFQPTSECYACYKKKPFSFLAIAAIVAAGVITGGLGAVAVGAGMAAGAGIACAAGAGGACRVKGAKFTHNSCQRDYAENGSPRFCRKRFPSYPAWFKAGAGGSPTSPPGCAAFPATAFSAEPSQTYQFDAVADEGLGDDMWIDRTSGRYCEAQASCHAGTWEPMDAGVPMEQCGRTYTEIQLMDNGTSERKCTLQVPDAFSGTMIDQSYYTNFPYACVGGTRRCKISGGTTTYPKQSRDPSSTNFGPTYFFYEPYNYATDISLPGCA